MKKDKHNVKEINNVPLLSDHIRFGSAIGRSSSIHKARGLSNTVIGFGVKPFETDITLERHT